jgi:3-keto-5-aminohexanoate cleavage enzyme
VTVSAALLALEAWAGEFGGLLGGWVWWLSVRERPAAACGSRAGPWTSSLAGTPIPIQMPVGVGLSVPFRERERLADLRPRMATLNPCSMSLGKGEFSNPSTAVRRLAARMCGLGVRPKLEIYDTGRLEACVRLEADRLLAEPLWFSIVVGVHGELAATPQNLVTIGPRLPRGAIWQVIAIGRASLSPTAIAPAPGRNARAGTEDTLHLRTGELAPGNRPLAGRAIMLAPDLDLDLGIAS